MGEAMLQVGYLRRVVGALDRITAGRASGELRQKLRGDALTLFESPTMHPRANTSYVAVEDGGAFLLEVDAALGDGSGALLTTIGQEMGNRYFATSANRRSDVWTSMRQASGELTTPFHGCDAQCRVDRHAEGLELFVSVPGQPKATRVWRHLSVGYLRAAFTFSFEATSIQLRVVGETVGDRAYVTARYRKLDSAEPITPPPPSSTNNHGVPPPGRSLRSIPAMRAVSVADEVDRILRHAPRDGVSTNWRRSKIPRSG